MNMKYVNSFSRGSQLSEIIIILFIYYPNICYFCKSSVWCLKLESCFHLSLLVSDGGGRRKKVLQEVDVALPCSLLAGCGPLGYNTSLLLLYTPSLLLLPFCQHAQDDQKGPHLRAPSHAQKKFIESEVQINVFFRKIGTKSNFYFSKRNIPEDCQGRYDTAMYSQLERKTTLVIKLPHLVGISRDQSNLFKK